MRSIHRDVPVLLNGKVVGRGDVAVVHSPPAVEVTMTEYTDEWFSLGIHVMRDYGHLSPVPPRGVTETPPPR